MSCNWNELLEDPEAIDASPLERVVGIGLGRSRDGLTLEVYALEVREMGSFLTLRIESPATTVPGYIGAELRGTDDIGTHYSVMAIGGEASQSGPGAMERWRFRYSLVPAIPSTATRIRLTVTRIAREESLSNWTVEGRVDAMAESDVLREPWEFDIPI